MVRIVSADYALCRSDEALISAVTRHAQEQVSLDLSKCTRWLRFLDVHYTRTGKLSQTSLTQQDWCISIGQKTFNPDMS